MSLIEALRSRRVPLLERWSRQILEVYSPDTAGFVTGERDRFRNPVGHDLREGAGELLEGLLGGLPPERLRAPLDRLIRIRAVQDLTPSQAIGFVFLLKQVLEQEIAEAGSPAPDPAEWRLLNRRIDRIALEAFEIYCSCREQIYEIRAGAIRRQTARLQQFVDRCYGASAPDPDVVGDRNENGGGSRA